MGSRNLRAFLAATSDVNTESIRQGLTAQGVTVEDAYSFTLGEDPFGSVAKRIRQADFVVAIIAEGGWTAYEVGIADALMKPVLIIADLDTYLPAPLAARQVLRTGVAPSEIVLLTLRNFVEQVRRDPRPLQLQSARPSRHRPEKATIERLLPLIEAARTRSLPKQVENLALELLEASGATVVAQPANVEDRGVDFAIWTDSLAQVSGGPLLVEVKAGRLTPDTIRNSEQVLARAMAKMASRIALLLYLDRDGQRFSSPTWETPFVLRLDLEDFAKQLVSTSFAELVIQQRNRLVHRMG